MEIIKSMNGKNKFLNIDSLNIDSNTIETAQAIENIEKQHIDELRAHIQQYFTPLEIETMKYIAQNMPSKKIAQIQNVTKSTIERRKEYIIEKASKYFPEIVIDKKQILTIKNIVWTFHLLDEDDSENTFIDRLKDFIKTKENK